MPASLPETTDVVIVGAGIAGLVTAYELKKRGVRTRVLEARPASGGRVATAHYGQGLKAEYGLQEIWSNNPLAGIATELGVELETDKKHSPHSTFMHEGRIYPDVYDGSMRGHWDSFLRRTERRGLERWLNAAERLHHRALARGLNDPDVRPLQDISCSRWLHSSEDLSDMARVWLRLHLEAEVGSDWRRVSALFALLEMQIFFAADATCCAVAGGNSRLIVALEDASGPLTVSARVTGISRRAYGRKQRLQVRFTGDRGTGTINARHVVLAVPCDRIQELMIDPPLSAAHRQSLGSLQLAQYVPVHLIMDSDRTPITTHQGIAVPNVILTNGPLGFIYGVVSENATAAVFSLLVFGEHARAFHTASKDANLRRVKSDLDGLQAGFGDGILDAHVYTGHPAAIPRWAPGRSPLDQLSALLREPADGLHFAGDYIHGAHSDGAAQSGISIARRIAEDLERRGTARGAVRCA